MNLPKFANLRQEPINSGIITGFLTLCAIAFVNLFGRFVTEETHMSGLILLAVAAIASLAAGAVAFLRSQKITTLRDAELKTALSLAAGDFSNALYVPKQGHTALSLALTEIADRQLAIERNNGQLIQEASTRENHLLTTLDCVSQEIAVYDKSGLLVCANSGFLSKCNIFGAVVALGMTRKEVWSELAKAPRSNLPLNERQSWFKIQEELRQDAAASSTPVRFTRLNGEAAQISMFVTKDGHQVEITEEIAGLINLEQRVLKAERETTASDRLKQVTLSRLSHTIRTPMTGVLAAAELLSDTTLDTRQRARLDIIRRSAGTLLGVVQDMFDMADAANSPITSQEGHTVSLRKQALICSTPESLALEATEVLSRDNYDVTAFESFSQLSKASETLQLAVQKQASLIVLANDEQKAQILAMNEAANLSDRPDLKLFSELLMQTKNPSALIEILETPTESVDVSTTDQNVKLDVLIVESNEVNQIYLSNNMKDSDYAYKIVGTGTLAIEIAQKAAPNLILLDISIPDIDGLQVTAAIRAAAYNSNTVPLIIGLTNHFVQGDQAKCLNAGMDQYMAKPQTGPELISLIEDWLNPAPLKMVG
jgi:CheY-like chemotaxis protein/signal transduction histidine kinase